MFGAFGFAGLGSTRFAHRAAADPEAGIRASRPSGDDPSREAIRHPSPEAVGPAFRLRRRDAHQRNSLA